ncbi:MAG: aminoacyl-tRNA deacylase [Gammaproteobacteria bacterium]
MPVTRLTNYLIDKDIRYSIIPHMATYTAQETAASTHIPGIEFAKTVMVKIDKELAMAVLPAQYKVNLSHLKQATDAMLVELAVEDDFVNIFPGCETGAMPPFGNLYGLDVYVDDSLLADEEIAFNAGSHKEIIKISYQDFMHLVRPQIARFMAYH